MMSWRYSATFEAPHCLLGQVAVLRQREGVDDGLDKGSIASGRTSNNGESYVSNLQSNKGFDQTDQA